jgi:galactose mutarotase-like enzyme
MDTLHGGPNGWDYVRPLELFHPIIHINNLQRTFKVVAQSSSAITFFITDPDGSEGFPGTVWSYISYALTPHEWHMRMNATADKATPLMLSSHVYWNLDGFQNPNTQTALDHTLSLPYSAQRVDVDGILIPTGNLLANQPGSVNDFWTKPKTIGASFQDPEIKNNCGTGCSGYDTCYLVSREQAILAGTLPSGSRWWAADPVASLSSAWSGIRVDVYSDQDAFQIYSCNGQNGKTALNCGNTHWELFHSFGMG